MEARLSVARPRLSAAWRDALLILGLGLLSRFWLYGQAGLINEVFGLGRAPAELLCSWDCGWYQGLAQDGYHQQPLGPDIHPDADGKANWAFFPLFPLAARALVELGLGSFQLAAQLLNNLAFCASLGLLFSYLQRWLPRQDVWFVLGLLALSPYSLYFSAPYTESLYLLLMLASLLAAHQGRWLMAGLCGALLSATRNLGVFLAFSLAALALQQFGWRALLRFAPGTERAWLACVLCGAGLFAYMAFLQAWVGDSLAFSHVQAGWGGEFMNPFKRILQGLGSGGYERYCALSLGAGLAAGLYLARCGLWAEALVLLIGCLIPATVRLPSAPRYVLTLFPIYLAIGLATRGRPLLQLGLLVGAASFGGFLVAAWMATKVVAL